MPNHIIAPQEDHLPPYRVRPRFQVTSPDSTKAVEDKMIQSLAQPNAPCRGKVHSGYISLYMPFEEQHYWSPRLTVTLEEHEEGSLLRGLYGPRPSVWTMFVFFYSVIGFAIVVVSIIGFANRSLGKSGAILWLIPVLVTAFLSLYLVAYFGQQKGHDEMITLHTFLEESTGLNIDRAHQEAAAEIIH
ncbi:MAG: hypothetical protein AAFP77_15420 [Bacteroidota bacterium]